MSTCTRLNVTTAIVHIFLGCYHVFTDSCEENGVEFTQYMVSLKVRFRLYLSIRTERDITNTTDTILHYFHMSSVCMKRLMQTGLTLNLLAPTTVGARINP